MALIIVNSHYHWDHIWSNCAFDNKLMFHEEGIELFYSSGHTIDCISVFDNLEKPLIYVQDNTRRYQVFDIVFKDLQARKIMQFETVYEKSVHEANWHVIQGENSDGTGNLAS